MYAKTAVILAVMVLAGAVGTAHAGEHDTGHTSSDEKAVTAGMIGADSPLYGLELAFENAAIAIGLQNAGVVAQERVVEAREMLAAGKPEHAQKAVDNLAGIATMARASDAEGLNTAMTRMQELLVDAPDNNVTEGMRTALENMKQANQRIQDSREQIGSVQDTLQGK